MRLIIKNVENAYIGPAVETNRLNIHLSGIEPDDVLFQIDIQQIINYYGITELLDFIGNHEIKSHLMDSEENTIAVKKKR